MNEAHFSHYMYYTDGNNSDMSDILLFFLQTMEIQEENSQRGK